MTDLEKKVIDLKKQVRAIVETFESDSGLYVKSIDIDRSDPAKTDEIDSVTLKLEA